MSCTFWLRRKRAAAEKERERLEAEAKAKEEQGKKPAKKAGAKNDGRTDKKS